MALVASSVDAPSGNIADENNEHDVLIMDPSGNQPDFVTDTDDGGVPLTDFIGNSASSSTYPILTYPLEHTTSPYMPSGYGRSPEFLVRLPRDSIGVVGQPVALECQIDGHPLPDIMWTKDDDDITDTEDPNYSFELDAVAGLCRLTIEKCRETDQGVYRCILENCFGACSSTTSLRLTDKAPSPNGSNNGSKTHHTSDHSSSHLPASSSSLQPQGSPQIVRELTTISEHLSQEDTTSFSASLASDGAPAHIEEPSSSSSASPAVVSRSGFEEAFETASTITNNSMTPLELSVTNSDLLESWVDEANKDRDDTNKDNSNSVRTVMNYDPPHWRQFCITPVQTPSDEEPTLPILLDHDDAIESLAAQYADEPSVAPDSPSKGRTFIELDTALPEVAIEEPTPPYSRRQLMIRLDNLQDDDGLLVTDNLVTDVPLPAEKHIEQFLLEEVAKEAIIDATSQEQNLVLDLPTPTDQQLSPSLKVSFNNCQQLEDNSQTSGSMSSSFVGPAMPIHRTMSSPSTMIQSRRRSSFLDYFTDPKTRRRTIILQSLIAIQIVFLACLAILWQEHIVNNRLQGKLATTTLAGTGAKAALKQTAAAAQKASTALATHHVHQASQHASGYFAILTTPLSFVFVLIISSLFTFIFASTIQL